MDLLKLIAESIGQDIRVEEFELQRIINLPDTPTDEKIDRVKKVLGKIASLKNMDALWAAYTQVPTVDEQVPSPNAPQTTSEEDEVTIKPNNPGQTPQ